MEAIFKKAYLGLWLFSFLIILGSVPRVFGAEMTVATHPKKVTVFPNGARVVREGVLELPAGTSQVLFPDLPASVIESSLHLNVEGPAGTKLYGITLKREFTSRVADARTRRLQEEIQELEDQKTDLGDKIEARRTEIGILKGLVGTDGEKGGGVRFKNVTDFTGSADAVGKRIALLAALSRKDERGMRNLDTKIAALRNELAKGSSSARERQAAEAELELPVDGTARFTLTYQVPDAGWSPVYDLRLDTEGEKPRMDLEFNAQVRQITGEDWREVALTLSTARPEEGTQIPDPTDWWLDYFTAQVRSYRKNEGYSQAAPAMEKAAVAKYLAGEDKDLEPAQVVMAQTIEAAYAMNFSVTGRKDIASDGSAHRMGIAQDSHSVELTLVAVPKLSAAAYLEAKVTYRGDQMLLPGPAQLFRDGNFVGTTSLQAKAPGESFDLGFGQDDQIRVERKLMDEKTGKTGFFSSKGERTYRWVTTLANYHKGVQTVEVREQLPRSRQKEITVESLEVTPKPLAEDPEKPGLLRWKLDLKPKEKAKITFAYKVNYPPGAQVAGME